MQNKEKRTHSNYYMGTQVFGMEAKLDDLLPSPFPLSLLKTETIHGKSLKKPQNDNGMLGCIRRMWLGNRERFSSPATAMRPQPEYCVQF